MTAPLRILLLEDSPDDAELVARTLRNGGVRFESRRVDTEAAFVAALESFVPDLILADYMLPGFDGLKALELVRDRYPDLPFIFVTGTMGEERAVDSLHRGAEDYVLKDRLQRLPDAARRALRATAERGRFKEAERSLQLAATVFRASSEGIVITDPDTRIVAVNPFFTEVTGYPPADIIGKTPRVLKSGAHDQAFYQNLWATLNATGSWQGTITNRRKDGGTYDEWLTISTVKDESGRLSNYVGIFSDLPQRRQLDTQLQHLTQYDALTDLPNRGLFLDRFEQALLTAQRYRRIVALVRLNLSRFRVFNDTYGQRIGDMMLKETARRLLALTREGDTVTRLSSDEFGILLTHVRLESDVIALVRRMLEAVAEPWILEGNALRVSANIGISLHPNDGATVDALLRATDSALRRAKQAGRDNFRFFTPSMDADAERRLHLEADLHGAVERNELELYYQPQIDLFTGHINGMEALVRWNHPRRGQVSPAEFIPLAEDTGLIQAIGAWTLVEACRQNKRWIDAGLPQLPVAVNLSARQFHRPELLQTIRDALAETGLPPRLLELELTESAFIGDVEEAGAVIKAIKDMGIQLALDDFGTGYSSLSYLSGFPFDKIKIDQSFIRDVIANPINAAIATATIAMGRSLRLMVLAEGVETDAQMEFLRSHRCEAMQGYLFSRPVTAAQLQAYLEAGKTMSVSTADASGDTLLLVDDEPSILHSLVRQLRHDNYVILTAESPARAFELLASHKVQVVVSDQRMPEMNGTEFLARVKQMYPDTIRIVLSGYTDLESVTDAINRGAIYRFLTKPWDDETLRSTLREAFRVVHGSIHA